MNNGFTIKAESPLLRPGLSVQTTTSKRYAKAAAEQLMDIVRDINDCMYTAPTADEMLDEQAGCDG